MQNAISQRALSVLSGVTAEFGSGAAQSRRNGVFRLAEFESGHINIRAQRLASGDVVPTEVGVRIQSDLVYVNGGGIVVVNGAALDASAKLQSGEVFRGDCGIVVELNSLKITLTPVRDGGEESVHIQIAATETQTDDSVVSLTSRAIHDLYA